METERRPKDPNEQLAALIAEAGISHKGLAARVVQLGRVKGRHLRYNHSSVVRWLNGETPRSPVADLLAEVLSGQLGRRVTIADLGMEGQKPIPADAALQLPRQPGESIQTLHALVGHDLVRRRRLIDSGFDVTAYVSAALRWIIAPRTSTRSSDGSRTINEADVDDIRQATNAFRVLDNSMGGGRVRPTVIDYLHHNVVPLLREARCTEDTRRSLFSAAAELTQLAGWLAYDLEWQGVAQRYLVQSLAMARFAGDASLGGEILAAMSHQAIWVAQAAQAVDLAQAAQVAARQAGQPVLETESLVMEAHAHALRGDAVDCSRALKGASVTYSRAGADLPIWLRYFDDAYFAARIAHCFRALGQGVQTEEYALKSLDMDSRFLRGKAFNIVLLASGYAVQGELEEACRRGREAIVRIKQLDSARAVTYIRNLLAELKGYKDKEVDEFTEYAESELPSLRRHGARR